jgi:thiol-disulfide isomerase/thioredoxin
VGIGLPGNTLAQIIDAEKAVIIHFLRHLGCIYCRHSVDMLYKLKQEYPTLPTIYFVHQSSPEVGQAFFEKRFPGAPHISDPDLALYRLFEIPTLSGWNLLNPKMIWKGLVLTLKGYGNRLGYGNIMILSGTFLFYNGVLKWSHRARFAGDEPKWDRLSALGNSNKTHAPQSAQT